MEVVLVPVPSGNRVGSIVTMTVIRLVALMVVVAVIELAV